MTVSGGSGPTRTSGQPNRPAEADPIEYEEAPTSVYGTVGGEESRPEGQGKAEPEQRQRPGRAPSAKRDPVEQLRALREQASSVARRGGTPAMAGGPSAPPVTPTARPVSAAEAAAAATAARSAVSATPARRTPRVRKARLRLVRVDPWSVMKVSFLLSIAAGVTIFVAVAVVWSVLDAAGVFASLGDVVREVTASDTSPGFDVEGFLSLSRVLGFTTLLGVVDVVLFTALATLGAFLYNLAASLLGGLEVTLAEDD